MAKSIRSKKKKTSPILKGLLIAGAVGGGWAFYKMSKGEPITVPFLSSGGDAAASDSVAPSSNSSSSGGSALVRSSSNSVTRMATTTGKSQSRPRSSAMSITRNWRPATFPLTKGMQGDIIGQLQVALKGRGANIKADGKFGADTEKALLSLSLPTVISADKYTEIRKKLPAIPANETPEQALIRKGYNKAAEIEPAKSLHKELTGKITNPIRVRSILERPVATVANIVRAYKFLFKSTVPVDLAKVSLGKLQYRDLIVKIQSIS